MEQDYDAQLLQPLYREFGVPAVLTIDGTDGGEYDLTVIDETVGAAIALADGTIDSVQPAAIARVVELTAIGLTPARMNGGLIEFNGNAFTIRTHRLRPSPNGEGQGEVYLILSEATA